MQTIYWASIIEESIFSSRIAACMSFLGIQFNFFLVFSIMAVNLCNFVSHKVHWMCSTRREIPIYNVHSIYFYLSSFRQSKPTPELLIEHLADHWCWSSHCLQHLCIGQCYGQCRNSSVDLQPARGRGRCGSDHGYSDRYRWLWKHGDVSIQHHCFRWIVVE